MNISNTANNDNLISNNLGFYLYELLGADYSGVYVANKELMQIARKLKMDINIIDGHKIFAEILKVAREEGMLVEALNEIKILFETRLAVYDDLADRFNGAVEPIEEWRIKLKRAIRKIESAIKEVKNEPISN